LPELLAISRDQSGNSVGDFATRRLAAVAFVDIVGYTILMSRDETRTHRRWMSILNDLITPQAKRRRGRVVKSTGDGVLVEFPSALDAVEWAQEVQRRVAPLQLEDDGAPATITMRIAVHIGDLMTTSFDVYGDGVNVAARLQEHGVPGGIIMSEAVHDLVRGTIGSFARDLGYLQLKNLEKSVRAYSLDPETSAISIPVRARQDLLPSIAVLPLQDLGGGPDDYFGAGIVEDIVLSLAGLRELLVISRASTLGYSGPGVNPREVGAALGVRYLLLGTVRRSTQSVRVSVELCSTESGASVWGDTVEVPPGELFDIQDRIVGKIVSGIAPNVRATELRNAMRKKPESFTAYDHVLRALYIINSLDVQHFLQARTHLYKAMSEDPNFSMAAAWSARWHSLHVGQGWSPQPNQDAARALELAAKAIELDGQNALALATYGHVKSYLLHECESALRYFDRALKACPNHSLAWILSGATLAYVGRGEEAVRYAENGLRLSPFDQSLFYYYMILNLCNYAKGDYEEAVRCGRMSASENPKFTANARFLAAALVALGRVEEAQAVAKHLMTLEPKFSLREYERTRQPLRSAEMAGKFMDRLREAGLPD
jgi:class 3 adenylate cyclase/TolB-like protein